MGKRLISLSLALVLSFSLICDLAPKAKAVLPASLFGSALASYLTASGIRLWGESDTGTDLINAVEELYNDFATSTGALQANQYTAQDLFIDSLGRIVVSYTACGIFSDFTDWLVQNHSITDSSSSALVEGGGFTFPPYTNATNTVVTVTDVLTMASLISAYESKYNITVESSFKSTLINDWDNGSYAGYMFFVEIPRADFVYNAFTIYCMPRSNTLTLNPNDNGNPCSRSTYGVRYNAGILSFSGGTSGGGSSFKAWVGIEETTGRGDVVRISGVNGTYEATSLFAKLAQSVATDIASSMDDDQSLAIGVGAAAGAGVADVVQAVSQGLLADSLAVTDTVVATDTIDTPVYEYPDVDDLGLPSLGLALTSRFPFCIPWDIGAIYSAISAPSEPPVVSFSLIPDSVLSRWNISCNTTITIDLTEEKYAVLLAILHWSSIIGFCLGLAVMTKRYIWTTGG